MQHLKICINPGDIFFLLSMSFVVAFPNPSIYKALSIVAFFVFTVAKAILEKRNTHNLLQYGWAIAFFTFGNLSKMWSVYPPAASEVLNNVQWGFLMSVAIVNYIVMYKMDIVDVTKRMVIIALVFLVDVVLNGGYIDGRFTVVINGYFLNENAFGQIALGIACYLMYWSKKKNWKNMFINGMMVTPVILALISGSRKSLISFALYVVLFVMYEYPPKSLQRAMGKILAIMLTIGIVYFCVMNVEVLYNSVGVRIESLLSFIEGETEADGSAMTRVMMIKQAFNMFLDKPLLGYGLNTFAHITTFGAYSHNNYVELLANTGIIGFLIYYTPLFVYFSRVWNSWKKYLEGAVLPMAIIGSFLINDFANVSYYSIISQAFLALAIGLCINININAHREENIDNVW